MRRMLTNNNTQQHSAVPSHASSHAQQHVQHCPCRAQHCPCSAQHRLEENPCLSTSITLTTSSHSILPAALPTWLATCTNLSMLASPTRLHARSTATDTSQATSCVATCWWQLCSTWSNSVTVEDVRLEVLEGRQSAATAACLWQGRTKVQWFTLYTTVAMYCKQIFYSIVAMYAK